GARPPRRLQRRRRRAGTRLGMASGVGERARREAPAAHPALARATARRRGGGRHDDRGAPGLEREGQARAGLGPCSPQLARRICAGGRVSQDRERLLADLQPGAFAIAYRMLGSVSEAEDVVQEALLRVEEALRDGERIASPRAYIATI